MEVLKQLNIKATGADPKACLKSKSKVFLCRIFGEAIAFKSRLGPSGDPYCLLLGSFRAVRPAPVQQVIPDTVPEAAPEFSAPSLCLPGGMEEKIVALLAANKGKSVQFAYDISAAPDASQMAKYSYGAVQVIAPALADHVKALATALAAVPTLSPLPPAAAPEATPPAAPLETKKAGGKKPTAK